MSEEMTGAKAMILLLAIPFTTTLNGFVLSKLWLWFIVGTFNMRPLRIAEAIGVAAIVRFMTYSSDATTKKLSAAETLGLAVACPLFAWGYGWCIHLFI